MEGLLYLSKARVFFCDEIQSFEKEMKEYFKIGQVKDYSMLNNVFQRERHGSTAYWV